MRRMQIIISMKVNTGEEYSSQLSKLRIEGNLTRMADWKDAYAQYEQIAAEMENYQYTKEEA